MTKGKIIAVVVLVGFLGAAFFVTNGDPAKKDTASKQDKLAVEAKVKAEMVDEIMATQKAVVGEVDKEAAEKAAIEALKIKEDSELYIIRRDAVKLETKHAD